MPKELKAPAVSPVSPATNTMGSGISIVTGGKGAMPWFRGPLSDQQIADVIGYVRTHFGNKYKSKVTAAMVAENGAPVQSRDER